MSLEKYFSIYDKLTPSEQNRISNAASLKKVPAGTLIYNGESECLGLLVIRSGQLRAYINSEDGREVTLYRLLERDICLFSAACMMNSIQFSITITAEKESEFWVIAPDVFKQLTETSVTAANYVNSIMATRFTEVMWLIEQIMWKSIDRRLAHFLLEESTLEGSNVLKITHENIAAHLGTAREVVTRMLKYFRSEGMVSLTRGTVELIDIDRLEELDD